MIKIERLRYKYRVSRTYFAKSYRNWKEIERERKIGGGRDAAMIAASRRTCRRLVTAAAVVLFTFDSSKQCLYEIENPRENAYIRSSMFTDIENWYICLQFFFVLAV